jgi:RecB family exonuclease
MIGMSFSRLNTFEICPAKFDYLYITKSVQDEPNEASAYGDRVHKTLELYGKGELDTTNLTIEQAQTIKRWGKMVSGLVARPGDKYFEHRMCIGKDLQPLDWFDKQAYIRAIADLLIVDGDTAYCFDYKTGKVKDDDSQLKLSAVMVMKCFPQVKRVKTAYIWLLYDKVSKAEYTRDYLEQTWKGLSVRFDAAVDTIELGFFEAKPSGLCPWCPAHKICPSARLRGRR